MNNQYATIHGEINTLIIPAGKIFSELVRNCGYHQKIVPAA